MALRILMWFLTQSTAQLDTAGLVFSLLLYYRLLVLLLENITHFLLKPIAQFSGCQQTTTQRFRLGR